ncbi:MAG: hypothetical protein LBQ66_07655 [Planctomycetaceae bacterium]|jgi:hypothetical protein|nr:hypothetical protein [Planctomycetaceae bacterium]
MSQTDSTNEKNGNESAANTNTDTEPKTQNGNTFEWAYSGKAMRAQFIFYWVISLVAIGVTAYLWYAGIINDSTTKNTAIVVAAVLAILWLQYYITYFYRVWTIKYKLIDTRLYCYRGLFIQTSDTMELLYIRDLQLVISLFDKIFNGGVGKLIIFSAVDKTDSKLVITGIDNPNRILEIIDNARSTIRGKRTLDLGGLDMISVQ